MSSSIFFNEPTVIDHSFIDEVGRIVGGSVNPSFTVTGAVTSDENVVLDFSSGKKRIKDAIDDNENGFDHKCWIVRGISQIRSITIVGEEAGAPMISWSWLTSARDGDVKLTVTTPQITIVAPKNAFRFVANAAEDGSQAGIYSVNIHTAITREMTDWLNSQLPEFSFDVEMRIAPVPSRIGEHQLFRYVHGLKRSSSWGCQNIAHGHLSYIDIEAPNVDLKNQILMSIAKDLDNTIFINSENLSQDEHFTVIEYESQARGSFMMWFNRMTQHKYVVLETETTIEHIIEYVAAKYSTQLKLISATKLYVSEGLSKGAVLELNFEN